jgi:structural maintenance of chromosome 4
MEYSQKTIDCKVRIRDLEEATETRNACRREHEELRRQRLEAFMSGFSTITLKLKEMYQMITLGGDAELELVDSLDPFSEGIVFSVRPPKKSWKNISNLSGGEKTLSSLALVFALHHYKPTPLYVMDEIDAALDFKNVSIVANYIKERTKNAQVRRFHVHAMHLPSYASFMTTVVLTLISSLAHPSSLYARPSLHASCDDIFVLI